MGLTLEQRIPTEGMEIKIDIPIDEIKNPMNLVELLDKTFTSQDDEDDRLWSILTIHF